MPVMNPTDGGELKYETTTVNQYGKHLHMLGGNPPAKRVHKENRRTTTMSQSPLSTTDDDSFDEFATEVPCNPDLVHLVEDQIHLFLNAHDDDKCYCRDVIQHLKINERKYYLPECLDPSRPSIMFLECAPTRSNPSCKKCPFAVVRQRIIEWILCLQDFYKNTEETLEMTIRIFDYIYFNDLLSNYGTDGLDEKYFQCQSPEMELIYRNYCAQRDNDFYSPRVGGVGGGVRERCLCGSFHNGWLKLDQLQLVALACYHLACKFWERFPPRLSNLMRSIKNHAAHELIQKEKEVLVFLNFDLKIPLIAQYIEYYSCHEVTFAKEKLYTVCSYLSNLTLTDPRFVNRLPSLLAAVILTLARLLLCCFSIPAPERARRTFIDESLIRMENFAEYLDDLWVLFMETIENKELFHVQRMKFSSERYGKLTVFIENFEAERIRNAYRVLLFNIECILCDSCCHGDDQDDETRD